MAKYLKLLITGTVLLCTTSLYAGQNGSGRTGETGSYTLKYELAEWGIYSSLYAGAYLLDRHGPFMEDPLIGGATGKPYKKNRVPASWLAAWMGGVYGYIALFPNEEGSFNRVTYDNIKGFYESVAYAHFITVFTKVTAGRKRPSYDDYPESDKDSDGRMSFISGHSSTAFVIATYSSLYMAEHTGDNSDAADLGLKAAAITASFSAAIYTAWSRVEDNRHHKSDVIAGGAVGILSGCAGYIHQNGWFGTGEHDWRISLIPVVSGDTVYMSVLKKY